MKKASEHQEKMAREEILRCFDNIKAPSHRLKLLIRRLNKRGLIFEKGDREYMELLTQPLYKHEAYWYSDFPDFPFNDEEFDPEPANTETNNCLPLAFNLATQGTWVRS